MTTDPTMRLAYILKMYPRFSETFIVNEILAHEAAGLPIEIVSLRPPADGRFHENYAHVQAHVTYAPSNEPKLDKFLPDLRTASLEFPQVWSLLAEYNDIEPLDLCQALWIARWARQHKVTHLHAHFATVATSVAWLVHKLTGIPYFFTAHAKDIFHEEVSSSDLRRKLAAAAAVITVSDFNLSFLRQQYDTAAARVDRVYNGLDMSKFPFTSPADRPKRIVTVGRLVEKKGFSVLVGACALLKQMNPAFECEIIGGGPLEADLRRQIGRLGVEDCVHLLGALPQSEVIRHVQGASVFACPCVVGNDGNRDGLPTVLIEAMALGTPCIATDVTGIPEVLRHNHTGLQVEQHNPEQLAQAIHLLLNDSNLRIRLAMSARRLIEEKFDSHRNSVQIRALYKAGTQNAQGVYEARGEKSAQQIWQSA